MITVGDDAIAQEVRQQEAVNDALDALLEATRYLEDYPDIFLRIGRAGLTALQTPSCLCRGVTGLENEWNALVGPLALSTNDEVERKYLLSLAIKRVLESALNVYRRTYRLHLLTTDN